MAAMEKDTAAKTAYPYTSDDGDTFGNAVSALILGMTYLWMDGHNIRPMYFRLRQTFVKKINTFDLCFIRCTLIHKI